MTLLHTAIRVADVEAEVSFYGELADLEVVRSFETEAGIRNVFLGKTDPTADDDAAIQLVEADGPVETGDFVHVALKVPDVDRAVERLEEDLVVEEPRTLPDDNLRVAFAEDPEGWGIELIEFEE